MNYPTTNAGRALGQSRLKLNQACLGLPVLTSPLVPRGVQCLNPNHHQFRTLGFTLGFSLRPSLHRSPQPNSNHTLRVTMNPNPLSDREKALENQWIKEKE